MSKILKELELLKKEINSVSTEVVEAKKVDVSKEIKVLHNIHKKYVNLRTKREKIREENDKLFKEQGDIDGVKDWSKLESILKRMKKLTDTENELSDSIRKTINDLETVQNGIIKKVSLKIFISDYRPQFKKYWS